MFRDNTDSDISPKLFGVGSTMIAGSDRYLVCACATAKYVSLLDLKTFKLISGQIKVIDVNFLSEDEVRDLGHLLQCTLSDFDFDARGLKG